VKRAGYTRRAGGGIHASNMFAGLGDPISSRLAMAKAPAWTLTLSGLAFGLKRKLRVRPAQ